MKTLEDKILVSDLKLPSNIKLMVSSEEIIASVAAQANIEEELAKEITEDVENVEKVEKPEKEAPVVEGAEEPKAEKPKAEKPAEEKKPQEKK